ncbi:E3 ubiquitin-protein ligase TRIM39-like [Hypanus sabinus]|uniref:E3 ubiquitin-protein ligase TRIM39-like n=1 Tax=Hypanus sabinus TaxID=79690 RepID=UPI0028C4CB91|nr:E3 ubiquitin-protein ligase TRIM39-like [Hypanus sabinus]
MASKGETESLSEEAICPICLDFFTDPVSLECGHNFCRSCITQYWEREERNFCPVCREVIADRTLRASRALANLAEKFRNLNLNPKRKECKLHCEEHEEELKLFCETDKTLICLVCRDAQEHREHRFKPIKEAVKIYKDQLKSSLDSLTKKKSDFQEKEQQQKEKISGVWKQSHSVQSHITFQFAELRQEEARRNRRISDDVQELSVTDEALPVEKFDHLYLLKTVLRETLDAINRVSVTLDVETAHPRLEVSEDRKSVRRTGTRRDLPDTGKRFTIWLCVLGSEGFTSGRHYWEVEVTGIRFWCLGVATESVKREERVRLSPETGFWVIGRVGDVLHRDCDVSRVLPSPKSRLAAGPIPGRVGVYLNYESGTVSVYNAETKSHLHTFSGNKFTEKLYPFFRTVDENLWLRISSGSTPGL